ncbi:restriction endonuclease [Burkholderia ubonensis]|uniref:restriction endonuclease n=1 Tax=Burkholderia ubonensis TaxID=101571 RepID=UPI000B16A441|nr:restriction endonuclease [Burkholderia ubonensis]
MSNKNKGAGTRGVMSASRTVIFSDLAKASLHIDCIYESGRVGNAGDDPLNPLLKVSIGGGFRYRGTLDSLELVVLTTTMTDPDWPDVMDRETGVFTYYGDNKKPGQALHETPRRGNRILRNIFDMAHGSPEDRRRIPPIFIFATTGIWRDMTFLGLAVPGSSDLKISEDLVAIWKIAKGRRFQNYRAHLTILDEPTISREWLNDIVAGNPNTRSAPENWRLWIESGERRPLLATRSLEYRKKSEQLPIDAAGREIIALIQSWFAMRPHDFERCAGDLACMMLRDVASIDITRPSRDGGRDAIGKLRIGNGAASILVDFAIEAKCYSIANSVGVREISRLISRLRHRQFGILITTSFVDIQAYKEIKEDGHPIIVVSAIDILEILRANGRSEVSVVRGWLEREYPNNEK